MSYLESLLKKHSEPDWLHELTQVISRKCTHAVLQDSTENSATFFATFMKSGEGNFDYDRRLNEVLMRNRINMLVSAGSRGLQIVFEVK